MSIQIIKQGLLDTMQDEGRYGIQHIAVNPGGVMDTIGMRVANALVGNEPGEAVLEMHFPAAEILFEASALIAIGGADFSPLINGEPVPVMQPVWINKNATLRFQKQLSGARGYLAVQGGFRLEEWMGSRSTHLKVNKGGFEGRALRKTDRIFFNRQQKNVMTESGKDFSKLPWTVNSKDLYSSCPFHFVEGAEYEQLDDVSKQALQAGSFLIAGQSDRMGYRLQSSPLSLEHREEMISTAVTKGTIQLLPDGQLIILMADHQTTGGYPRMGHIISADIPSLAQAGAGSSVTLKKVSVEMAEQKLLAQQRNLRQLRNACIFRLQQYFT